MHNILLVKEVKQLRESGMKFKDIANKFSITINTAKSLCRYKRKLMKKKRGPKRIIDKKSDLTIRRTIYRLNMESERVTSPKIIKELNIQANVRTVQKYLKTAGYKYKKSSSQIFLKKSHKQNRVESISSWISDKVDFQRVIFSDEKRFSMDGPDNWSSYVMGNKNLIRKKRQCGGGSLMIWMMVMPNGLLSYHLIDGKFNSLKYKTMLETYVVPLVKLNYQEDMMFQHDNCRVHVAGVVNTFLNSTNLAILKWPSLSPDINIVEDIWRMISLKVYDSKQFNTKSDLLAKIENVILYINNNEREKIINLYSGFMSRLCQVLVKRGNLFNKPIPE